MTKRIVLTGGGASGGHFYPLLAVAQAVRAKIGAQSEFLYVGSCAPSENDALEREGIRAIRIASGKWRRYASARNITDLVRIAVGFFQSLWILFRVMPDAVFSKGGSVAVPVVAAAWIYRIPVITHESDAVPGVANRMIAAFASRVAISYSQAAAHFRADRTALTGIPLRKEVVSGVGARMIERLHLDGARPTVLILGGSQGARRLNDVIVAILPQLLRRVNVIHQTGVAHFDAVEQQAAERGIKAFHDGYAPVPFLSGQDMGDALDVAVVVVSRAGATAIAEIAAHRKPAVLVPLSTAANDEQRMNAFAVARVEGALVLEESNLGEHLLLSRIVRLLDDKVIAAHCADQIAEFYHPEAADRIADELLRLMTSTEETAGATT